MWGLFLLYANVIEICVLWLLSGSFWYCRQWTHLTWCFSILKQVVDPRKKKSKPTAICLLCTLSKDIQSPQAFFFINNKKANKGIYKISQHLRVFYILSINKIGRIYQTKANCKLIPNCLSIAWTFPTSYLCVACPLSHLIVYYDQ